MCLRKFVKIKEKRKMEDWFQSLLFSVKTDIKSVVQLEGRKTESHLLDIKLSLSKIEERLAKLEDAKLTHQIIQHDSQKRERGAEEQGEQPLSLEEPLSICVSDDEELPQFKPPNTTWEGIFDDNEEDVNNNDVNSDDEDLKKNKKQKH